MKKLEVNHKPYFVDVIFITIYVLWLILLLPMTINFGGELAMTAKSPTEKDSIIAFAGFFPFIILFIIASIECYIKSIKTTVEYDIEKVHWEWLLSEHTVNFSDLNSVCYTVIHERTRYGYNRRFEIVFCLTDSTELRLNDRLESDDIDNSINGTPDNIKLMQLYRFIENIYPEKCSGFVKSNNIF